jgi:hypothetical protein
MEFYISNRDFIKNLAINTGTTSSPTFTTMCTASELGLETDMETKDWYVFCDSLQRRLTTGASVTLTGTIKLDVNNAAISNLLGDVHTLIADGEIAQFNNKLIQFELLTGVNNGVLEYTKYQVQTNFTLSDLGGAAEDEGEFSLEMTFNGTASEVTSA